MSRTTMRGPGRALVWAGAFVALSGCTTFSSVRSAEVYPGLSFRAEAAAATPPGEGAAWFYTYDCWGCTAIPPAVELGLDYGIVRPDGRTGSVGLHLNGFYPQLDGYVQVERSDASAWGLGARLGVPIVGSWATHEVYGRYDRVLGPGRRILYNPALTLHAGNSPNGENPGHMLSLVQGFGFEFSAANVTFVPSATLVLATGRRSSYGEPSTFSTAFATLGGSVTVHRPRPR